ncbi:MAG TPA: PAS domain S-box protein [Burkholderiales bacterium]|nr:PAS domain S-box protein [Burkholderiales bacterium]
MSLRFRINLLITALMLIFMLALAAVIIDGTRSSIHEEVTASTRITMQLLGTVVYTSQFIPGHRSYQGLIVDFLDRVGRVRASEIRLYDVLGNLIYQSPPSPYKAGRYAPGWFAALVTPKFSAMRLRIPGGTLLVVPDASRSTLDAWDNLARLFWVALAFFVVANALIFWLIGRSLRPITAVQSGLLNIAQGRFDTRLPRLSPPEFDAIGSHFNRMAQTLQHSVSENQRLALIVRQSSDAILIHDLDGRISFWNPSAERLFGYSLQEAVGRPVMMLVPPGREPEITRQIDAIRRHDVVNDAETQRVARDGRIIDIALSVAPLVDPDSDGVAGCICSMRDITERKQAEHRALELEKRRQITQLLQSRLEEERRGLARELHDELGQCITAIKSIGTSIARQSAPDTPVHASANTIVSVAGHIYDVVHDIVGRLRPGALDTLGLADTLKDLVAVWASRHPEIEFRFELSGDVANLGEAIDIAVYRVVQECVTNTVRHAGASRVAIHVMRATADGEPSAALTIAIADDGKGMDVHAAVDSTRFGLAGIRERVEALNGHFDIDSAPGSGVRVNVTLPLTAAAGASLMKD